MPVCPSQLCPLAGAGRSIGSNSFDTIEALMEHAFEARSQHPLCIPCQRVFKDKISRQQHMEAKHVIYCDKCDRKFYSPSALEAHYKATPQNIHPKCRRCNAGMRDNTALATHMAVDHPRVMCCGMEMFKDELPDHYLKWPAHPHCEPCFLGFENQAKLTEHNTVAHPPPPPPTCTICEKRFRSDEELERHMLEPGAHRRCEYCPLAFKDMASLIEHSTITHMSPAGLAPTTDNLGSQTPRALQPGVPRTFAARLTNGISAIGSERRAMAGDTPTRADYARADRGRTYFNSSPAPRSLVIPIPAGSARAIADLTSPRSEYPSPRLDTTPPRYSRRIARTFDFSSAGSTTSRSSSTVPTPVTKSMPILNGYSTVDNATTTNDLIPFARPDQTSSTRSPSSSSDFDITDWVVPAQPSNGVESTTNPVTPVKKIANTTTTPNSKPVPAQLFETPPPPNTSMYSYRVEQSTPTSVSDTTLTSGPSSPPASSRSKHSFAETPSGDLSNFHLLNGSPLQHFRDMGAALPSLTAAMHSHGIHPVLNGSGAVRAITHMPPVFDDGEDSGDESEQSDLGVPHIHSPSQGNTRSPSPMNGLSPRPVSREKGKAKATAAGPSFHCRLCFTDPCDEPTATVCGHIFCNKCIVEEVKRKPSCPVCHTAVLLYAMLRLDVMS